MSEPFLAEVRIVGFNFAPRGWGFCDGQILPINQNQSLNLYRENAGDMTPLAILDGNGNTGGNGTVAGGDVDNTDPPVVAADAGINPTDTLPTLPAIVIP